MRVNLNVQGCGIVAPPMHASSRTPLLLPLLLSLVSHSTCPPLSSSPRAHSFVIGPAVIKHTHPHLRSLGPFFSACDTRWRRRSCAICEEEYTSALLDLDGREQCEEDVAEKEGRDEEEDQDEEEGVQLVHVINEQADRPSSRECPRRAPARSRARSTAGGSGA